MKKKQLNAMPLRMIHEKWYDCLCYSEDLTYKGFLELNVNTLALADIVVKYLYLF